MLTPFAVWPAQTRPILTALVDDHASTILHAARAGLPAVLLTAAVLVAVALRDGDRWTATALVILGLLFIIVPPLIAFGVYFALWHAARQICQQLAADSPPAAINGPTPSRRITAWAARAAPPTAITLIVLAVLTWRTGSHLPVTCLALLLSLTVPHSLLDAWQARAHPVMSAPLEASRRFRSG